MGQVPYVAELEVWLRGHSDEDKAVAMAAYMRDQFPFLGIKSPERVEATRQFLKEKGTPELEELDAIVRALWKLPEREYQYTALLLMEKRLKKLDASWIGLLEMMITTASWWDTVDIIAGKLVGGLFGRYPELIPEYGDKWIASDNLWLRRSALLFQLGYKGKTDKDLLFGYIRQCADEEEFFIRKAIGWALREYAKTDEHAVRAFVKETPLSALSVREALKRIGA
ncbi:DNA alkylation repair protein [Paenibacillus oenotherae]|uniref:DNA alkylation repair protein n=1 Tax=Paenibacillus oenotherae TaxID=1435645 RepID=UPI0031BB6B3F